MKDFFKFMFASMLGFFLISIILFFIFMGIMMAMLSFAKSEEVVVNDKTLLHLKFDYRIEDRTSKNLVDFGYDFGSFKTNLGLNGILKNLEKAKTDDRIEGIYLDLMEIPSGLATISEIRKALADFKETGKFIYAYGEMLTQKAYYLASVADKIYLNPEGIVDFRGFNGEVVFIKGLLEKLEIEPQIIRHGKFKSAIEPLILDKMSEANKEQTLAFISSMWKSSIEEISYSRNIEVEKLNIIADKLETQQAEDVYKLHIVDSLVFMDQFLSILADKLNTEQVKKNNLISLNKYNKAKVKKDKTKRSRNKVAVIYAIGSIAQGEGSDQMIGSDKIAREIRNARLDKSIKAIVLRVNSPGGDAIASDIILREVMLAKQEKPIVVSMGNVAASGGYYISCGADKIIADPTTITGSIGVFGLIPNFQKFFNNKLGITFDEVKTNENSDFPSVTKPLSEYQYHIIQVKVDKIYETFINHVANGRNMTNEEVNEIAQGRVWSGVDALKIGLVDELGGLDDAIRKAVDLAALEDYRLIELPRQKELFEQIMEDIIGETKLKFLEKELGKNYRYYNYIKEVNQIKGVQARLPFEIDIK
ncbi:MAG: signal peptide peptidase SppA [Bacteroidetes bacterium]|nr:signal peptide peptidase SppA [Bacteroidota bacterium]MBL7104375.1 signal peptide peptidase SppA [Bacteroidales bacterium]